jgi:hypothetical protein
MPRFPHLLAILLAATGGASATRAQAPAGDPVLFYETEVKPILQSHCLRCHGAEEKIKGKLNFTTRAGLLKGGESGPAISLDKPGESLLLQAISYTNDDLKMPPKGKLPKAQTDILTQWVHMGAPYGKAAAVVKHGPPKVDDEAKRFWSFKPVVRPSVPVVKNQAWVKNPIDAFLLAKLEAAGLAPAPPADRVALLRRVYYDVIGLPPTPQEVEEFLNDKSADAYEKVVDRLLASPHYGEQWARHWLDLVRYAETNSFERDSPKPNVWRYRDYVIRAFNDDMPYDRFLREQLAGDELDEVTHDTIIATGYYRLGIWDDEAADKTLAFYDDLDDVLTTTGHAMLGLTINCARCHDHKLDPIPTKDYYRFLSFFHGIRRYGNGNEAQRSIGAPAALAREVKEAEAHRKKLDKINKKLTAFDEAIQPQLPGGERDDFAHDPNKVMILKRHVGKLLTEVEFKAYLDLRKERSNLDAKAPKSMQSALCVTEVGTRAPDAFILARGNPTAKGEKVEPGFPSVLTDLPAVIAEPKPGQKTSGRRRVLADWIAGDQNQLTYRVIANRIWQWHFGRGIVRSSSNFGYQGTPPTHPELLDWLASELVTNGKSIKKLNRLILLSQAYQISSLGDKEALAKDPENDLFWRFNMRRLRAEEIRDSILAASGNLNAKKMFGPSIFPHIPKEVLAGQSVPGNGWTESPPDEAARRSVYVHIKRSLSVPILVAFDVPDTDSGCPVRFTTTQPTQALGMINGHFLNEQATIFAGQVTKEAGIKRSDQVRTALWRVMQRAPSAQEIERGERFIERMQTEHGLSSDEGLRRFCLIALNLNEFVFLD